MRLFALVFGASMSSFAAAEDLANGVDRMLARTLTDPLSAIDYRVSAPVGCKAVLPKDEYSGHDQCVCYSVNAKNQLGGYSGAQLFAASYIGDARGYIVFPGVPIDARPSADACSYPQMAVRPAGKIAELVPK